MYDDLLKRYGFSELFFLEANLYPDMVIGRICSQYKDLYKAVTPLGEVYAEISGKFRYTATRLFEYPAVVVREKIIKKCKLQATVHRRWLVRDHLCEYAQQWPSYHLVQSA